MFPLKLEFFKKNEKENILKEWLSLISFRRSHHKCISLALKIYSLSSSTTTKHMSRPTKATLSSPDTLLALLSHPGVAVSSLQGRWGGTITHLEFRHFSPKAPKSWLLGFPGPCLVRPWLNCWLPSGSPVAHGRPVRGRVPFKWHSMELIYQINNYMSNLCIYILTLQTFLRCFHNSADENALPNTHTQTFHKQPAVFFRMYRLRLRNKD